MSSSKILSALLVALIAGAPSLCHAASIQMLPPTQLFGATEAACTSGQGNKMLTWDGTNPMRCQETVTVDNSSLVIKPQASATEGGQIIMEGAPVIASGAARYDSWFPDVYQNNLRLYSNSGNNNQVQIFNNAGGESGLYVEGSVGVGTGTPQSKLDVAGGVKVANDAAACAAAKAGTIRWNGAAVQYCDGAAWKGFSEGPTNPTACGDGTLVQWDNTTKTYSCKPIYAAMTCTTKTASGGESVTLSCDPGYYVVAGSCWRSERTGGSENWMGGLFIGDSVSKTAYTCRIEGAAATNVYITCCK